MNEKGLIKGDCVEILDEDKIFEFMKKEIVYCGDVFWFFKNRFNLNFDYLYGHKVILF